MGKRDENSLTSTKDSSSMEDSNGRALKKQKMSKSDAPPIKVKVDAPTASPGIVSSTVNTATPPITPSKVTDENNEDKNKVNTNIDSTKPSTVLSESQCKLAQFQGWWKLDVQASETMKPYLETLGLSATAVKAALKTETEFPSFIQFKVTPKEVTIKRKSRLSRPSDEKVGINYKLGMTTSSETKYGQVISNATILKGGILNVSETRKVNGEKIKLSSQRKLLETKGNTFNVIEQIITLHHIGNKVTVTTKRIWRRQRRDSSNIFVAS